MPKLTVHNAEIKTAAVEVKTLTISGKQVTLSVFRQIPHGSLFNADGSLRGIAWGTVNYHPDEACKGDGPHRVGWNSKTFEWCSARHMHVVWQRGTELHRDFIWDRCDRSTSIHYAPTETFTAAMEARAHRFSLLCELPQLYIAV